MAFTVVLPSLKADLKNCHADPQIFIHSSFRFLRIGDSLPLLEKTGLRIESIHSRGQVSPDGFWYDQQEDEWVMLAQGGATLEIETQSPVTMRAGDYLLIPRGIKHRVSESSDDAVWLVLHIL